MVPEDRTLPRTRSLLIALAAALLAVPAGAGAAFSPDDPGFSAQPGGWQRVQWNFAGPYGVGAMGAWEHLIAAGRPGGAGVVVAVVDSGVAYRNAPPFERSPDLARARFVRGHDIVDHDAHADDATGHGTHIASTIAETTNNGLGLTGLAYGVRIMPVRVLDSHNRGTTANVAAGIRWAAAHGAQVINVSIQLRRSVLPAAAPVLSAAVRFARARGAVVVAAAGNDGDEQLALPAALPGVIAVGATTEHGCLSDYSDIGSALDLVAPGGGADAPFLDDARCDPGDDSLRDIFQLTLQGRRKDHFGYPGGYEGTSMAAPHVSAVAALVIASGVLGADPTPDEVEERLEATSRDLGTAGRDRRYGWGLLDADAATRPGPPERVPAPSPDAPPSDFPG